MKTFIITPIVLASVISFNSQAEESRFYALGAIGQSKTGSGFSGENATSFGFGGGYWFNDNFAIEGRYDDFGEVSSSEEIFSTTLSGELSASAFSISLLGGIPISEKFKVYAKVGISFWDVDLSFGASSENSESDNFRASFSGEDFSYGLGARFQLTERFCVGAEYSTFSFTGKESVSDTGTLTYENEIDNPNIYAIFSF